jgi:hypothetical protein
MTIDTRISRAPSRSISLGSVFGALALLGVMASGCGGDTSDSTVSPEQVFEACTMPPVFTSPDPKRAWTPNAVHLIS